MKRFYQYSRSSRYRINKILRAAGNSGATSLPNDGSTSESEEVICRERSLRQRVPVSQRVELPDDVSSDASSEATSCTSNEASREGFPDAVQGASTVEGISNTAEHESSALESNEEAFDAAEPLDTSHDYSDTQGEESDDNVFSDNHFSDVDENPDELRYEYAEEDYGWDLDDKIPVYDTAPINLGESMLAILSFYLKHNLSLTAVSDLLQLIDLHCRQEGNRFIKSLHQFKKYFANIQFPIVRHYYCKVCFKKCHTQNAVCPKHNKGNDFFIQIPLISQQQALYKRPGFREKLNYKFNRTKFENRNLEDIYDGAVYCELSQPGQILSNPSNISFTWYSDGVSIFNSSKSEIWPFYLTINELPYNERAKVSNALLAGIWFGKVKPKPSTFLQPIRADLIKLQQGVGMLWGENPVQQLNVKAIVLCGTADIPAKALFLNFKNHNASYGCAKCQIEIVNVRRGLNVYPYRENFILRTEEQTLQYAREALQIAAVNGVATGVFGVVGPSILSTFVYKWVQTVAVDEMHCVYLGLTKALLKLWFEPQYKGKCYSLRNYVGVINERLSKITPPSFVQRLSRTLDDFKYWKGHELKTFLFYYSLAVLNDLMIEVYFDHHKHLLLALYLLNQRSVSEQDINLASELLTEYVSLFQDLYGIENMTCNLHQLLHVSDVVRNFGPLWVTSCFPYEDMNGKLKNLVKGTRYAELQVCSGVSMLIKFAELINRIPENGRAASCVKDLFDKMRRIKTINIGHRLGVVGKVIKKFYFPEEIQVAIDNSAIEGRNYFEFYRLMKCSIIIGSELYEEKGLKTKSTCVKYTQGVEVRYGFINHFLRITHCHCQNFCNGCDASYMAIVQKCVTSKNFFVLEDEEIQFIHTLRDVAEYVAIDVRNIMHLCFVVKIPDVHNRTS